MTQFQDSVLANQVQLEGNVISVKTDTTALHKTVVQHVTALLLEHNHHSWTSATKILATVTVSLMWKATTVISVNRAFIICLRVTLRGVHSVHVTPKELLEDQDSVNSNREIVLVSHWWLVRGAISVNWEHMVSTNQIQMDVSLVTAFPKEQQMVAQRDQVKLDRLTLKTMY